MTTENTSILSLLLSFMSVTRAYRVYVETLYQLTPMDPRDHRAVYAELDAECDQRWVGSRLTATGHGRHRRQML